MAVNPLVRPMPLGGGNPALWLLKYEVDDERFLQIFADFSRLLRRSEKTCEQAANTGNEDYAQAVGGSEADYIEEIIGASFLVLQAKIRRVTHAAERLRSYLLAHQIDIADLQRAKAIKIGGRYKRKKASLIELVWDIGNYYKHRDEWPVEVWRATKTKDRQVTLARKTRKSVERVGITMSSTGNMRKAYEFFGLDPYSKCEQLAEQVQDWAKRVYDLAQTQMKAKLPGATAITSRKKKP